MNTMTLKIASRIQNFEETSVNEWVKPDMCALRKGKQRCLVLNGY